MGSAQSSWRDRGSHGRDLERVHRGPSVLGFAHRAGDGVYILRVYEDVPPPQEFAVAKDEWINHLRSAFDYTLWAAAARTSGRVPQPNQGQIQ